MNIIVLQFDEYHCVGKVHKVLWKNTFTSEHIRHYAFSFQAHTTQFRSFKISRLSRFWGILGTFPVTAVLFCHLFGGRDALKKRKIREKSLCTACADMRISLAATQSCFVEIQSFFAEIKDTTRPLTCLIAESLCTACVDMQDSFADK